MPFVSQTPLIQVVMKDRRDVDVELVEEPSVQALLDCAGARSPPRRSA
ncbi:hypothetical protein [Sorangium cellulosum]|nr:hypothetical protein [Sorangium cellulosum]